MRSRSTFSKLLVATAAACALAPAAAHAATLTLEGNTIVYRGEGSEGISLLLTSQDDNGTKYLSFYDSGADRQTFDPSICHTTQYSSGPLCVLDPNRPIRIEGSEAKDSISIFSAADVPDSVPITVDGKGGDDQIKDAYDSTAGRTFSGGAGNDKIEGYGGNDVIDGGDGNDEVDGGEGSDEVHAGAGDDVLYGDHFKAPGADVLDGGPGFDQIDEWNIPDAPVHPLPSVSLNGAADDGRPGEGDNVQSIEKFTFHINTTFTGSDAAENVEILNVDAGSASLDGGGGNDILKAYDTNDTVNGGPGDDQVEGGLGNDTVTGGPGKDMIMGDATASRCSYYSCKIPFGNDTIYAQDGEADQIDCGIGDDVVYADAIDTTTNCETVNKGAAAPAGPAPGKPGPGTATDTGSALSVKGSMKLATLLGGKLSVAVPCSAACRVSVTAKANGRTVATGKATLLAAGSARVKLKVSKKAKASIKRAKKLKVTLTATITGADGKPQKLTRSLTLKK
jgi:Ca2+-binding RTX toxin-like protein